MYGDARLMAMDGQLFQRWNTNAKDLDDTVVDKNSLQGALAIGDYLTTCIDDICAQVNMGIEDW